MMSRISKVEIDHVRDLWKSVSGIGGGLDGSGGCGVCWNGLSAFQIHFFGERVGGQVIENLGEKLKKQIQVHGEARSILLHGHSPREVLRKEFPFRRHAIN
ncbi:MAG TPA: hypothetical protein VK568_00285 [Thermodesulfobacteriota bacterium]|nr:hypothetical protein [Thermodesulfobacteriota bacterium]